MSDDRLSRRDFLRQAGSALCGSLLAVQWPALAAAGRAAGAARDAGAAYLHLAPADAADLEAIAARIIPRDDLPGAREAGVIHFIDQSLGSYMAQAAADLRRGLAALNARAADEGGRFAELPEAAQDELLRAEEDSPFFGLMHFLTVAGMFAMPAHGGNRDEAGWKLLGFDHRHAWLPPFGYYDGAAQGDGSGG